jgi:hypothetical protein
VGELEVEPRGGVRAEPPAGYVAADAGALRLGPEDWGSAVHWDGRGKSPLEPLSPGLFRYRPVSAAWARRFAAETRRLRAWSVARGQLPAPANSLSDYGFDLAPLGFRPLLEALLERAIEPWRERLFRELRLAPLDQIHGFVVEYGPGADADLSYHVDQSELTLNLCLDGDFVGSELCFAGLRCLAHRQEAPEPSERLPVEHEPGVALLHAGALRHWVEPIQAGRRTNLILWATSEGREPHGSLSGNPACPACARRGAGPGGS